MDIDLLSKMVKEMILDNDSVTLPGIGSFVAEVVPATFSDKGYTINPPYRRLFFRQRHQDDSRLIDFYCQSNGVAPVDGERILTEFLAGLKEILIEKKNVILPGLGRLRATKENNFFFVPDEDLDIYPYGFGLEPVSLKTHEETPEEVSAAVQELHDALAVVEVTEPEPEPERKREPWLAAALWVAASVVLFLGLFRLFARIAPDLTDKLLYSEEELRIINY